MTARATPAESGPAPESGTAPVEGRRPLAPDTIRRIEQATAALATQSVARMDERLPWFRELPSAQRSWVTLVAQAGLQSFVEWLRSPDDVLRLTGEVFAAAPRAMARSVTLQQTVELVRTAIAVAEEHLPVLAGTDEAAVREELLRFSREIAFAAAGVYARAAENRGSWDERLEALVIDNLVSGSAVGDPLPSRLAALGWTDAGPIVAVVGTAPQSSADTALASVHELARRAGTDVMAGVHGERLVVVAGEVTDPEQLARELLPVFGDGPVVIGPLAADLSEAAAVTQTALSALRAAPAWPAAPRPVHAADLLPERALAGDAEARAELVEDVFAPLAGAGRAVLETVSTFLDSGAALEATARALFVHANTVRYRLRRVAELCGYSPLDARGAFTIQLALALGRLETLT